LKEQRCDVSPILKTVIGMIPWTDMIKAAPEVIAKARNMMKADRDVSPVEVKSDDIDAQTPLADAVILLKEDVARLGNMVIALQEENRERSKLINTLAEQNGRLATEIQTLRMRLGITILTTIVSLAAAITALVLVLK
jgi:hypothetical protein